ncbi:MAG TPA: hypothetical protein VFN11_17105 [Ktedonobacterales bacterium]|nr:hypothetical protein [Ktedonobacterales bacterium]
MKTWAIANAVAIGMVGMLWVAFGRRVLEGTADVGSSLTPDALRDIAWALRTSLAQVTPDQLASPELADSWQRASDWLCTAMRLAGDAPNTIASDAPPFPLTGGELRTLQEAIDAIVAARLKANAPKRPSRLERLYARSFRRPLLSNTTRLRLTFSVAHRFSLVLASILALSLLLNILDLTLIADAPKMLLFGANLAVTLLAVGVWFALHTHLRRHGWALPHRQVHLRG